MGGKSKIFGFALLSFSIILRLFFLPTAPGTFYMPAHYYNLYLPNFGLNEPFSILPHYYKTAATQYTFLRSFLLLIGNDVLLLHQIIYVLSPIFTFFAYYLFFTPFNDLKKYRFFLGGLFSLIITWAPVPLLIGMLSIYIIMKNISAFKKGVIFLLAFFSLSLYWHSAHILFFMPLIYFALINVVINRKNLKFIIQDFSILLILLSTIISFLAWVVVRKSSAFKAILDIHRYLNLKAFYQGIFSKGSFLPPEYQYEYAFFMPVRALDLLKYSAYATIYVSFFIIFFCAIRYKKIDSNGVVYISFLLGGITFQFLYFIVTGTIGPAPIIVFLLPLFVLVSLTRIVQQHEKNVYTKEKLYTLVRKVSVIFVLGIFTLSFLYNVYEDVTCSPEFNTEFSEYEFSALWLTNHAKSGATVLSDANTVGYMAIWYGKEKGYDNVSIRFLSITLSSYEKIKNGNYNSTHIFAYNHMTYRKNLVYESLQHWNKFKPIEPQDIDKNRYNVIYNDGNIWLCKQ